ncbi:DUF115 domain-containing protein [bacterium]|nr:DUF115 domain-containing protein [bacterium]
MTEEPAPLETLTLDDNRTHVVDFPKDPKEARFFNPHIMVEDETLLPKIDSYETAIAKVIAVAKREEKGHKHLSERIGIDEETLERVAMQGFDAKRQWCGRSPCRTGDITDPRVDGQAGIRMVALTLDPSTGGAIWLPDWNHGDDLYKSTMTLLDENDVRVEQWHKNYEGNKPFLHGVKELKGSWAGKPVIVVGSSPSIEKHIPLLKEAAKNPDVKIIGCNRGFLDLPPETFDYMMFLDYACRRDWFRGFDCNKTKLIADIKCNSMVNEYWDKENVHWFTGAASQEDLPFDDEHPELGFCVNASSVSTSMLWFCFHYLQANPIILCGFDHSYPNLMAYRNEPLEWSSAASRGLLFAEEADTNRVVVSSQALEQQRMANDFAAIWCRNGNVRMINCTEGGTLKMNDRMPLQVAYDRFVLNGEPFDDEEFIELRRRQMLHFQDQEGVKVKAGE